MKSFKKEYLDRVEYYNDKGELHRENGPAIEYNNGHKLFFINGLKHREDGPAVEWNGRRIYYLNGKRYIEQSDYNDEIIQIKLNRLKSLNEN